MIPVVSTIRTGGQSGVDRAALDVARERGLRYAGWCVADGRAEDLAVGELVARYPALTPTPAADARQRTVWNVRDADATLIIQSRSASSPGTDLTVAAAELFFERPYRQIVLPSDGSLVSEIHEWLRQLSFAVGRPLELNIAGPRESEAPGIYDLTVAFLRLLCAPSP